MHLKGKETSKAIELPVNMSQAKQWSKCNWFIKSPREKRIEQDGGKEGTHRLLGNA